jgi:hypothetical protein
MTILIDMTIYFRGGRKGVSRAYRLSDPPIHQTIAVTSDRNLLNLDTSPPHSPLTISHDLGQTLPQQNSISIRRFQRGRHGDARSLPVANLIIIIRPPSEQVPPAPTRACTCMRLEREQYMPIGRYGERMRHNGLQVVRLFRDCKCPRSSHVIIHQLARSHFWGYANAHSNSPLTALVRTGTP